MRTNITPEQISTFPHYVNKWLKIGLSTGDCYFEQAKEAAKLCYKIAGLKPPKNFILADCPVSAQKIAEEKYASSPNVRNQARDQIGDQVYDQVRNQVWNQVRNQVYDYVSSQCYGSHDAHICAAWDFYINELKLDLPKAAELMSMAQHCGWWIPLEDTVILQHKPDFIHMKSGLLHKDGGPAIKYRSGLVTVYALNGVRVPDWLACTRAEELDPKQILEIDNAQVRAEFVKKLGVDRLCYSLGAQCIDKMECEIDGRHIVYELLRLRLKIKEANENRDYLYLKMNNPSVPDLWHVEGVPRETQTVRQALLFRNGFKEEQIDEVNGADWYQQGDLILVPKGRKKYKLLPRKLT